MLPNRIRQMRTKKGLSQADLAEIVNVKRNTVSTWERGTRKPDFDALQALAKYFDVSYEYLLGNTDDETQKAKPAEIDYDRMAVQELGDEVAYLASLYCRLSDKSQEIIKQAILTAYDLDEGDGSLLENDVFHITVEIDPNYLDVK